eukprot:gene60-4309_t
MKIFKGIVSLVIVYFSTHAFEMIPHPNEAVFDPKETHHFEPSTTIEIETEQKPTKYLIQNLDIFSKNFVLENNLELKEGYEIIIKKEKINIKGKTETDVFHAVQTLKQLLELNDEIPCGYIKDSPKFKHRGMLLDCSRHFMDVNFVKKYIDLLSLLKMNKLHWHLVDDQGWRIEIKKYPKLTQVGAWRDDYGGYYTQEDVKEIVEYSKSKFVEIIPEIEMPGHCISAIASYPHLCCFPEKEKKVEKEWGIFSDVYCAGKESTFNFLESVLEEIIVLFDSKFIHLGGDECPKDNWKKCKNCQSRMIDEKLKNEDELQHYFMKRMSLFLQKYDKIIIGWDEILEGSDEFPKNVIVQSWRGMQFAIEASKNGIYSIVSPTSHCYFDYSIEQIDLKKVYFFNPIPNEEVKDFILGGECNMWSERSPQHMVDRKVFPRILAMSEVLWSKRKKNYSEFHQRVQKFYKILDKMNVDYGEESKPVSIEIENLKSINENLSSRIHLISGGKHLQLYFSFDRVNFEVYKKPFEKNGEFMIYAKAIKNEKLYGKIEQRKVFNNLILNHPYKLLHPPSLNYPGISLSNGIRAPKNNFRDSQWMGFINTNLEIIFEMNHKKVNNIRIGCLNDPMSWIFFPSRIEILTSENNVSFQMIAVIKCEVLKELSNKDFEFRDLIESKFIKIVVHPIEMIPEWHGGKGNKAWIFVDQIEMEYLNPTNI